MKSGLAWLPVWKARTHYKASFLRTRCRCPLATSWISLQDRYALSHLIAALVDLLADCCLAYSTAAAPNLNSTFYQSEQRFEQQCQQVAALPLLFNTV